MDNELLAYCDTDLEREIIGRAICGQSSRDIAPSLDIHHTTVGRTIRRIKKRLEDSTDPPPKSATTLKTYFVQGEPNGPVKIGRAASVKDRLRGLQTGNPHELKVLLVLDEDVEEALHIRFSEHRLHGEWFKWNPELADYIASELSKFWLK